jgi:hypothetical protein
MKIIFGVLLEPVWFYIPAAYREKFRDKRFWFRIFEKIIYVFLIYGAYVFLGKERFISVGLAWVLYRSYRIYIRRCSCGDIIHVKRINKIDLSDDVDKSFLGIVRSICSGVWLVRRLRTYTFQRCNKCQTTTLIKIGRGPLTLVHIWWVYMKNPEQYYQDQLLYDAKQIIKKWTSAKASTLDPETDSPPFPDLGSNRPPIP